MMEILMTIEVQWIELEKETSALKKGWRLRLAFPLTNLSLFVAVHSGRRYLLLRTERVKIPPRSTWPNCVGLELLAIEMDGHAYLGVALRDDRFTDVFAALADDLARRIGWGPIEQAVSVFIGQLARWQNFLAAATEGLGGEAQRGLWGELHFLHYVLLPKLGQVAINGWKGPDKAHQDFQFQKVWVEVKTTVASQPQAIMISSERQLDDTHAPKLFLHVLALEIVEGGEQTLPELVKRVRLFLSKSSFAREQFETSLLAAGYLDLHALRYDGRGYSVRLHRTFHISKIFPRIIENDLRSGVGEVSYRLSLAACEPFSIPLSQFLTSLTDTETKS